MLLEVKSIKKSFPERYNLFRRGKKQVIHGVSFNVKEGECLGIIGESGSGKSTLGRMILGLEKPDEGEIFFKGSKDRSQWQKEMSVVFQEYTTSVNPRFKVKEIIIEPLLRFKLNKKQTMKRVDELLEQVGLNRDIKERYPHELSGGQLQRVCIARAIATKPKLILLDEAISSLDVSVQVQILDLLKELKEKYQLSYLFITHDLTAVTYICDRVLFFKQGKIIEEVNEIHKLKEVKTLYAKQLLEAVHLPKLLEILRGNEKKDERAETVNL